MSNKFCKTTLIKVPSTISFFCCKNQNLLILKSFNKNIFYINFSKNCFLFFFINKIFLRTFKKSCCYSIISTKKLIYTTLIKSHKKLNIIGTGFKVIRLNKFISPILVFKLGFSHSVYIRIKANLLTFCIELSKLFIVSRCYTTILTLIFFIKLSKSVNVYSGKGILFYNEKIKLKTTKNV